MRKLFLIILLLCIPVLLQASSPPPPPGRHGYEKNHDTPLGSGMGILLVLGLAYGGKKAYDARRR